MTFGSDIWFSRSGYCYLSRVSAVSRKPNVPFNRHGEGWREIILTMTAALIVSLSLWRHCYLACVCRSSRTRNAQYRVHLNYVMILSRILGIDSSSNVMLARCQEDVPLSTGFLLRAYSCHTINITFPSPRAIRTIMLFSPESHFLFRIGDSNPKPIV